MSSALGRIQSLFHIDLKDRWNSLTIYEQMANIGVEVGRSINWKKKGNKEN
jgi:hypothetical protein